MDNDRNSEIEEASCDAFVERRSTETVDPPAVGSPFLVEFFMVQGFGFRCMAYRNGEGKWREAFNDDELPGVIRVLG